MSKIVTERVNPPVPTRQWDWVAYIKGDEEADGPTGRGPTEAEALRDLCEQLVTLALEAALKAQAGCDTETDCDSQPWCRISGECHRKQPEPAQEPVAVFDERMGHPVLLPGAPMLKDEQPLYTASQPQRKPLTEEEIAAEWRKASECAGKSEGAVTTSQFVQMFARAIERKVRGEA